PPSRPSRTPPRLPSTPLFRCGDWPSSKAAARATGWPGVLTKEREMTSAILLLAFLVVTPEDGPASLRPGQLPHGEEVQVDTAKGDRKSTRLNSSHAKSTYAVL